MGIQNVLDYNNKMDRQSPTSMRYSYSNSSATDSMGISRSLERSGNYIGSEVLSARHGANQYSHSNNIVDMPIIEHPSESAYSSSIPSHYMDEPRSIQSQRTTVITHSQQNTTQHLHYQQINSLQMQNNNLNTSQSVYNYSNANSHNNNNQGMISSMDRTQYEIQISELKLMIKQQNEELQQKAKLLEDRDQLYNKYERCLVQLNKVVLHNSQLQQQLNQKNAQISQIQHSRDSVSMSRNNDTSIFQEDKKKKQDQIRRLKDSILVLQKQKDSYKHQMNNRAEQLSEIQMVNIEYENKIVLISQEVERLSSLNRVKNQQKVKLQTENTELRKQVQALKLQIQRIGFKKKAEHEEKDSSYFQKLQELYNNIENLTKIKIQLEADVRRLQNENKNKSQQYMLQIEKFKTQKITYQRQIQDLETRNKKLSEQLKNLSQNHNSSQMKLSSLSSETNGLHMKIKQLEEQLRYISHQHQINIQENGQLKNNLARMDEENKRLRTQGEKYQQQSIQLRRKIQQISVSKQKQTGNLGENIRQRDQILKDLQVKNRQSEKKLRQLDRINKQYENRLQQTQLNYQTKLKQFQNRYKQFQKIRKQLQGKIQQQQYRNKQYETHLRQFELKTKTLQKQQKQYETKNISLVSQLQNIQQSYLMLKSNKNIEQQRLRQTFTSNLSSLQNQLNNVNNYKNELNNKFEQKRQQNIKLSQQLQNAKNAKSEIQNKLRIIESERDYNKNEHLYLEERYNTLQKQYKQYIQVTKDNTYKLKKQQELVRLNTNQQLTRKESQIFEMSARLQQSNTTIGTLQVKLQQKLKLIREQQQQIEQHKRQSIHAQKQLDNIRLDFQNLVKELQYLKQSNLSKQKSFVQARDQLNTNLHERERVLNQKVQIIWKLEQQLSITNERCKGLQKQAGIQKQNSAKIQKQLNNIVEKYRILQKEYRDSNQKYAHIENQCLMISQQNQEYKSNIARVQSKYRQLEREINQAIQANKRLDERNKVLEREYNQNMGSMGERFKIVEKQYGESRNNFNKLEQRFKAGEFQYRQLEHKYRQLEVQWQQSETNNVKIMETVKQYQQKTAILQSQYRAGEQSTRQLQHQLMALREDNSRLQQQNTSLQNSINKTAESNTQIQYKNRQAEQEARQNKQSLNSLTNKYRTLQLQYMDSKEALRSLEVRHKDIQVRYNELQLQLTRLDNKYKELIAVHMQSEHEIQGLKEIASKTEQERYYTEQAKLQESQFYEQQIKNKDNLINNITLELQNKVKAISEQNTYINSKEQEYQAQYHKQEQIIYELTQQLNSAHTSTSQQTSELISQITILKQAELKNNRDYVQQKQMYEESVHNLSQMLSQKQRSLSQAVLEKEHIMKQKFKVQKIAQQKQQQIKQLNRLVSQRQYTIKQLQHNLDTYMTKINSLTQEMLYYSESLNQSKYNKQKEVQNALNNKTIRIQQLEKQLIQREQYYRVQIRKMEDQREDELRKVEREMGRKVQEKEELVRQANASLHREEEKYKQLVDRLQSIVVSNQAHYQQILEYLEKILKLNTELIIEMGKNNANIDYIKEDIHSINYTLTSANSNQHIEHILIQMRDNLFREAQENKVKQQEEENVKIARERLDRKEKQDILDREERIIKFLHDQKERSRLDREREEKKYRQLQYKIDQYNHNNIELIQKLTYSITESIKQNRSIKTQQDSNNSNGRQSVMHLQSSMDNILQKMQSLNNLFTKYNQQYHSNKQVIKVLEQNLFKLEEANRILLAQLEQSKENNRNLESQYRNRLQTMTREQQAASQTLPPHVIIREQEMKYEAKLQRMKIENDQMKKQFDIVVSQYDKTFASMTIELEMGRKEIQRLNNQCHKKQEQLKSYITMVMANNNSSGSHRNTNTNSSSNGSGVSLDNLMTNNNSRHAIQIKAIIQKYEAQMRQLSKQIERLQFIINSQRQKYYSLESYVKDVQRRSIDKQSTENNFNKLQKQITELNNLITSKNNQIQTLHIKMQSLSAAPKLNTQNMLAETYKYQVAELKNKLDASQLENQKLHSQIGVSIKTIQNLKNAISDFQKAYRQIVLHSQNVENKIRQLSSKYNDDLLKKNELNELDQYINKLQAQNKKLKIRVNQVQQQQQLQYYSNNNLKSQFHKMEEIIQGLKQDNFELRNKNYDYSVEFQKIPFMQQKIGKLNFEYDRVSQNNIQLKQEVNECRFAVGDQAAMERRLFESCLTIAIMAAEIQSLRLRIQDGNRHESLEKDNFKNKLNRIKTEQNMSKFNPNLQSVQSMNRSRNSVQYNHQPILNSHQQTFPNRASRLNLNEQNQLRSSSIGKGTVNIPKPSRHLDPNLSSLLRSRQSSRSKSKNKSLKIKMY